MLKVFYGENRAAAEQEIRRQFGEDFEVVEAENVRAEDLVNIFQGMTLFGPEVRKIVLKGASENAEVWARLARFADTGHQVIVWEGKVDKRSAGYKDLVQAGVEMREFPMAQPPEAKLVFGVLDVAWTDGRKAVEMVEKIEATQDPFMFFGLLVTQMLKQYEATRAGAKEKRVLKEMAKTDLLMKTTGVEPWALVKAFLLRVKGI